MTTHVPDPSQPRATTGSPGLPIRLETPLTWLVLAAMLLLTYARFFVIPYAGFYFSPGGQIAQLYVDQPAADALRLDDQIIRVGSVDWVDFQHNLRQQIFRGVRPGQIVPMVVERAGAQVDVDWAFPGPTTGEVLARLLSEWPMAYVFWLAGAATVLFVRPRDELRRVLIAFNFLTALWLIAGSTVSRWHLWQGPIILRSAVWLSVPVYLHLHWIFPQPFPRVPAVFGVGLYVVALVLAGLEWLQSLPTGLYVYGFLPAVAGSLLLLIAHYLLQPAQRRAVAQLVVLWSVALLPAVVLGVIALSQMPTFAGAWLIGLPALPAAYLYTAFRRRIGAHELRANRLMALYLFSVLWGTLLAAAVPAAVALLPGSEIFVTFVVAIATVVVSVAGFPRFERWVEQRVLGITWPAARLLEKYAERITTSLDQARLVQLLTGEVLPSLLIRESALLRVEAGRPSVVYAQGVDEIQVPTEVELPGLIAQDNSPNPRWPAWAKLVLPLRIANDLVGVWLLGRRDPDDDYGAADISLLQTIAHQTAIALTNIVYAGRLQALYQNAIDQREAERVSLSRELHDQTLQRLFTLKSAAADCLGAPAFEQNFQAVVQGLTHIIRGLRPPMLEYGLYRAIDALVDEWANRPETLEAAGPITVTCRLAEADVRYPLQVEQHLYRIVQQAGENALEHAQLQALAISGQLAPDGVDLMVEDDGIGFDAAKSLDPGALEAQGHFGLAGMRERAALIGAQIVFDSAPGRGTRIHLRWRGEPA